MKTKESIINQIVKFFEENEDIFNDCIEELDAYNGFLGDDRYYAMEELPELYNGVDPIEVLTRAYFGYDAETWNTDAHGQKEYGAFNPMRDYFRFNGYGNLVSSDYKDYSDHIDSYAVEDMANNRNYIDSIDNESDLSALFDELEQIENGDSEEA